MFVPLRFVLIKKLDALPFQLTEAQINCKKKKYILKIYSNRAKKKNQNENLYSVAFEKRGGKKTCLQSPWQQSCWSHYGFHAGCNREVFQRAPFIVQITSGTFVPSDKWQLIIYPDSAETTHSSKRCARAHTHTNTHAPHCKRSTSASGSAAGVHIWIKRRAPG